MPRGRRAVPAIARSFGPQFGGNRFVGVQAQQPFLRGLFGGGILLRNEPFPRLAEHLGAVLGGDAVRAVGHVRVEHDDDFAGEARHALQRAANARRLRLGDHAHGDRQPLLHRLLHSESNRIITDLP